MTARRLEHAGLRMAVFLLTACALGRAQTTIECHAGAQYLRCSYLLREREFNFPRIRGLAIGTLAKNKQYKLVQLRYYTDRVWAEPPMRITHVGYDGMREISSRIFSSASVRKMRIAELTAMDENVVLRFRDGDRRLEHAVLKGRDPLKLIIHGSVASVSHIQYWRPVVITEVADGIDEPIEAVVTTDAAITSVMARAVFDDLRARIPGVNISLTISRNSWMPFGEHVPFFDLFGKTFQAPTADVYDRESHYSCSDDSGRARCSAKQ